MSPEGVLFVLIQLALLANWPVAVILIWAAHRRPRIMVLTVMAVVTTLIATGISIYVFAVLNAASGYPVSREAAQIFFRLVLLGLAIFPLWFLWLFATDRFRDGDAEADFDGPGREWTDPTERRWLEVDDPVAQTITSESPETVESGSESS